MKWPWKGKVNLAGPSDMTRAYPDYFRPLNDMGYTYFRKGGFSIYSDVGLSKMAVAGKLAANTLRFLHDEIQPGISSMDIHYLAKDFIESNGGKPTSIGFHGFPASLCTSNNQVACHGIPRKDEILCDGDLISLDVTCSVDGWHGDTCYTYYVGDHQSMPTEIAMFLATAQHSRDVAISMLKASQSSIPQIGTTIQNYIDRMSQSRDRTKQPRHFWVLEQYTGHGIGLSIHQPPEIPHYRQDTSDMEMFEGWSISPGMCFTIEPIICLGDKPVLVNQRGLPCYVDKNDQWSVIVPNTTSAQFEHVLGVHDDKIQVFTHPDQPYPDLWNKVLLEREPEWLRTHRPDFILGCSSEDNTHNNSTDTDSTPLQHSQGSL